MNFRRLAITSGLLGLGAVLFLSFQNFTPSDSDPRKFRILWQVGWQYEDLADGGADRQLIANLKDMVDGYRVVARPGGLLSYWPSVPGSPVPKRPMPCSISFKRLEGDETDDEVLPTSITLDGVTYDASVMDQCLAWHEENFRLMYRQHRESGLVPIGVENLAQFRYLVQMDALNRMVTNLGLREERAAGKMIQGSFLINNQDFSYDAVSDKIVLNSLPSVMQGFSSLNLTPSHYFIYQEPSSQAGSTLLEVPLVPGGQPYVTTPQGFCLSCLPGNSRMVKMLADSFTAAGKVAPKFYINIRSWHLEKSPAVIEEAMKSPNFAGVNFEGSAFKLVKDANGVDSMERQNYIKGIIWLLNRFKGTHRHINFLMPNAIAPEKVATEADRDAESLSSTLRYVNEINTRLSKEMGLPAGQNGICHPRLMFIVASYGNPIHPQTFPLNRRNLDGTFARRAGTVAGRIAELNALRKKLCGI